MLYRVLALTALSLAPLDLAAAQSVYVAPGGVYIGSANVYVVPPGNGGSVAPPVVYGPAELDPTAIYPDGGNGWNGSNGVYGLNGVNGLNGLNGPSAYPPAYSGPLSAYAARPGPRSYIVRERARFDDVPRPPAPIPYGGRLR